MVRYTPVLSKIKHLVGKNNISEIGWTQINFLNDTIPIQEIKSS